jgi:hypothetical protein
VPCLLGLRSTPPLAGLFTHICLPSQDILAAHFPRSEPEAGSSMVNDLQAYRFPVVKYTEIVRRNSAPNPSLASPSPNHAPPFHCNVQSHPPVTAMALRENRGPFPRRGAKKGWHGRRRAQGLNGGPSRLAGVGRTGWSIGGRTSTFAQHRSAAVEFSATAAAASFSSSFFSFLLSSDNVQ